LASISTLLRGGGIPNLDVIQTEVVNILDGHSDRFVILRKLDTFTDKLNSTR